MKMTGNNSQTSRDIRRIGNNGISVRIFISNASHRLINPIRLRYKSTHKIDKG